jgi:hypothetical protein
MDTTSNQFHENTPVDPMKTPANTSTSRRSFLRRGLAVGGAGIAGAGLLNAGLLAPGIAFAHNKDHELTKGDIAILRFLAAIEIIETDLWQQYNELGGLQGTANDDDNDSDEDDPTVESGSGNPTYTTALRNLDGDMSQYIHDNTDDEFTHFTFINAFLLSQGADSVSLDAFRTLKGSTATGVNPKLIGKRITNLTQLTVDTSWWTRYRDSEKNPDLGDTFDQAIPDLAKGQFPAIPRNDGDLTPQDHIQAIANTAAFHFGFIEQGGTSLYPSLAQRVSSSVVLRILLSIGPTETMHFQTWHDKAGNAVTPGGGSAPVPLTDPTNGLTFPDLSHAGEELQPNLIMPEPTFSFLGRKFPRVSIIRPTETSGAAQGAVKALTDDGLFIGQSKGFFTLLNQLAQAADAAQRD